MVWQKSRFRCSQISAWTTTQGFSPYLNAKHGQSSPESAGGDKLSDAELQATWLRRVQTTPGDFLRVKFSYQTQEQAQKAKVENP